uniref:NIDO domain-containing protein n=1 Tax=Nothobranchius furzeri TaxID=105023 RepID=A0A8C6PNJ8_NOTFU
MSQTMTNRRGDKGNTIVEGQTSTWDIVGNTSSHSDDGSSPQILLLHPFVYFGRTKNQIYVNHNGHLTFEEPWSSYSPQVFPMYGNRDIIAPFWTDLDNTRNGDICYAQYTSGSFLQQVTQDINTYFSGIDFNATWILIATWYEVAYYPATGTQNTFQAVLTTDGQHSFVLLNYGSIDATTSSIEAGYDTVNSSHHFTIPGSFASNASGSNSIFSLNSNVNVPGRWAFLTAPVPRSAPAPEQDCSVPMIPAPSPKSASQLTFSFPARQCSGRPAPSVEIHITTPLITSCFTFKEHALTFCQNSVSMTCPTIE